MRRFGGLLAGDHRFIVPAPVEALLRPTVLPMDFIEGVPLERLAAAPQANRDSAVKAVSDLALRELFSFGHMQTDPNFANYLWRLTMAASCCWISERFVRVAGQCGRLSDASQGGLSGRVSDVRGVLIDMQYLSRRQVDRYGRLLDEMISVVVDLIRTADDGLVDFGDHSPIAAIRERAMPVFADRALWALPSPDKMFLQRKITGLAFLALRLRVRLPLSEMLKAYA